MRERLRGLYAIIDPELSGQHTPLDLAEAVLAGGCAMLQLRQKRGSDRQWLGLAEALADRCRSAGVPFVLNDRADLAQLVGAEGLHLGQDDLPPHLARQVVGSDCLIGLSTHSFEQAIEAQASGADIVALGPIFETASKSNPDEVVGLQVLSRVREQVTAPLVAIGGITLDNARQVSAAGADLGAVISALSKCPDPEEMARALHACLAK